MVQVLMRLHAVLALVLLLAESTDEDLPTLVVLVKNVSLEVAEVLDHLSTQETLVPPLHFTYRQVASNEKNL